MDSWESPVISRSRYIPTTGNFTNTYNHQSFSSSLLDAIYKSIDEQGEEDHSVIIRKEVDQMAMYKKKLSVDVSSAVRRPAVEERLLRRSADYEASHRRRTAMAASSSSDSSSGSGFSSSENESVCYRPVPAETKATPVQAKSAFLNQPFVHRREDKAASTTKKTKKQPASPGARFAGFLNSLLASAKTAKVVKQAKKVRLSSSSLTAVEELPSPAPSSTSSRSCLSKSGGAAAAGGKRSVRFYPVSVIVDEDSRPCGQKNLLVDPISPSPPTTKYLTEELKLQIMEKNRRVEEAADRILNRYQTRTEILLRRESWALPAPEMIGEDIDDSDDESDAASDVSSDLFELKNLGTIGAGAGAGERYREELPVYETTNFVTNRAIAHGLIM